MVSEPLLWPFLSSLVFISVTLFSTLLLPSQHPSQPLAVEPPTSSSRRPWVPNLQPPSLRSFTLHRPLPFASLLQILLQLQLWRYHWDRLAPIYTLVEPLTPSETARAPMRRSKVLFRWSRAPRTFHVPLHIWVFSHVPPHAAHMPSHALTSLHAPRWHHCWRHPCQPSLRRCWRHVLASVVDIILWLWGFDYWLFSLTVDFDQAVDFDCWLFSRIDFFRLGSPYPVFRVDFIFAVCFCILYL